jgi:hypothetical protein
MVIRDTRIEGLRAVISDIRQVDHLLGMAVKELGDAQDAVDEAVKLLEQVREAIEESRPLDAEFHRRLLETLDELRLYADWDGRR